MNYNVIQFIYIYDPNLEKLIHMIKILEDL